MPKKIPPENQKRFAELLETYLSKSGRKQKELAKACQWDQSMITKILKLQARPNLSIFHKFMAPFLVAHGGITHAHQVIEMAELLGGELDESDLETIAKAAERHKDPNQSQLYFRDRADRFRQTIAAALSTSQPSGQDAAVITAAEDRREQLFIPPPQTDLTEVEPVLSQAEKAANTLAQWEAVVQDLLPSTPDNELDADEVIAIVLDWESQLADPAIANQVWDWLGMQDRLEKLCQRFRLEFVLERYNEQITWNRLEWEWLDHILVEAARRHSGQAQLLPSQLAAFALDLGQIAFEAFKRDDGKAPYLTINLQEAQRNLPVVQGANWGWLQHVAQTGPIQLVISEEGDCQFVSREEAEFLSAQYVLNLPSDEVLKGIVQNSGRPFGVLRQIVCILHFTGRDEVVGQIIKKLLATSEIIPLRYVDAAHLLAACEAHRSPILSPLWGRVEEQLCQSWAEIGASEYRARIAEAMRDLRSNRFHVMLKQFITSNSIFEPLWEAVLRSLAILGNADAVETLDAVIKSYLSTEDVDDQKLIENQRLLQAALSQVLYLPATNQATLLEILSLWEDEYTNQYFFISALGKAGTIPALRALQKISEEAAHPKLGNYAKTQAELLYSPARAASIARQLEKARLGSEVYVLLGLVEDAKVMLGRSLDTERGTFSGEARRMKRREPTRILSYALARVWADLQINPDIRQITALGLKGLEAWPAFEICLQRLPLADHPNMHLAQEVEHLLPALASEKVKPLLLSLQGKAFSPTQEAILIRCLGRASGLVLGERFEQLLAQTDEKLAIAAIQALADSLRQAAIERLEQIAEKDNRPALRIAAYEALAAIGSEKALPYLQDKLEDSSRHDEACFQLAGLHHPEAEQLLALAAEAETDKTTLYRLYLPALAFSGGETAIQTLYEILSPSPDEPTLDHLRPEFARGRIMPAIEVWRRIIQAPSAIWRMAAVEVLVNDKSQSVIDRVIRLALEDDDKELRRFAQNCLYWRVPTISSEAAIDYILTRLEEELRRGEQAESYLLELLRKCLSGLTRKDQNLSKGIKQRSFNLLEFLLAHITPTIDNLIPLLKTLAYPEFVELAPEVERILYQEVSEEVQGQALETLIAMPHPSLGEVLIRLCRSSKWLETQLRASRYLAETADYKSLTHLPEDLRYILYNAAILRDIRFQSGFFRTKVIFANGHQERIWHWGFSKSSLLNHLPLPTMLA